MTAIAPGAQPDRYELVANNQIAFPVRFGGDGATAHAMTLRFGPALYGEAPAGHLLTTVGTCRHVVHDAVVWDYAVRTFVLGDVAAIDQLAETLDLTASVFGGAGRSIAGTVDIVLDLLLSLLTPGFIVVGTVGGIVAFYFLYFMLLALLAQWAFWWVVIPGLLAAGLCLGIRNARLRCLREAVLAAARAVLAESHDLPWSQP